jgi:hypothetical protein
LHRSLKPGIALDSKNLTPNPFPSGKGNRIYRYWVQGSPLPGVRGEEPRSSIVRYLLPFSAAIRT